jgi:hypothetical protein
MATAAKFIQPIPIFLAYLAPLDVDVVSYQVSSISVWQVTCYDNFCFSNFSHFGHFHGNGSHFEFVQPPKAATHYSGYSCKVSNFTNLCSNVSCHNHI